MLQHNNIVSEIAMVIYELKYLRIIYSQIHNKYKHVFNKILLCQLSTHYAQEFNFHPNWGNLLNRSVRRNELSKVYRDASGSGWIEDVKGLRDNERMKSLKRVEG